MKTDRSWAFRLLCAGICVVLAATLGACGGDAGGSAGPTEAATGRLIPEKIAAKAKADPLSPYPSQTGKLPKVSLGQSIPALSFAALDIANAMNFYEYMGVEIDYQTLQAGSTMLQAVSSGSIKIGDSASTEVATAAQKGLPLQAIQNTVMMTLQVCMSKSWADKKGVSPSSPLKDRVKALEGAKIAITGPGSVSDTIARWLVKEYSSLDPDNDMSLVQVGGAPSFAPSLDSNKIQAYVLSAPNCQQAKTGQVLIQPTEIPAFRNYTHEVLYVRKDWAKKNSDVVTRVATAVAMGNNFIMKHPDKALALLKKKYSKVDPKIIERAFEENIQPNIRKNGHFTQKMWRSTSKVLVDGEFIPEQLDTEPGKVWTNNYINVKSAQVH